MTQLEENLAAAQKTGFSNEELAEIDRHAVDAGINIWAASSAALNRRGRRGPGRGGVRQARARACVRAGAAR